jgi:diguanylate cyclase (GGDEF)-like protein
MKLSIQWVGKTIQRLIAGTAILAFLFASMAQAERLLFSDVFQSNKLVQHKLSGVNQILQDAQGFMWFAGEKGLARFDGSETRVYQHDSSDAFSLPSSFVRALLIDSQNVMWVGTEAGLCFYEAQLDRFNCGSESSDKQWPSGAVHALAEDPSNRLFIGTSDGVFSISQGRERFFQLPLNAPKSEGKLGVSSLAIDAGGVLWIGTFDNGVISFDTSTKSYQYFQSVPSDSNALVHNKISSLTVDKQNRLWIGTYGGGISVLNADRITFQNYIHTEEANNVIASNVIWDLFTARDGDVWICVDQGGVVRFNPQTGFSNWIHKPYDSQSLGPNQTRAVYEDSRGDLWVGAFPYGVSFQSRVMRQVQSFRHEPDNVASLSHSGILSILKDSQGTIWIGTEDGLNTFDPRSKSFTRYYSSSQTGLSPMAITALAQIDENTLWLGTWSKGLFVFDLTTKDLRPVDTRSRGGEARTSQFVWDILLKKDGDIWIGTERNGVGRFDRETERFDYYSYDSLGAGALPSNFAWVLLEDHRGTTWIGSNNGLSFVPAGDTKPKLVLPSSDQNEALRSGPINAMFEDSRQRLWIGTGTQGAFIYDPESGRLQSFDRESGTPVNSISGFFEDQLGTIWILTFNGLIKVDPDTFKVTEFGEDDGLSSNNFHRNTALLLDNGHMLVGSAEGLNSFEPAQMSHDLQDFPVRITQLRVVNQVMTVGGPDSPLTQAINYAQSIKLTYKDSTFAFNFAALDYRNSQAMRYAYLLDGFDDDWNYIGNSQSATYTNISPGHYRFRVKASSDRGAWIEGDSLQIYVEPPPWRTWWAYLIAVTILFVVGYFISHYFRLREHTRVYRILSNTDVLTGLANRSGVSQAARRAFVNRQGQGHEQSLCVIFMDIDHFKQVNDTRGHESGDRVLVELAEVIRKCLRQSDLVGRWGGEEFVLICPGVDRTGALVLSEKIRQTVEAHSFDHSYSPLSVTVSLGVAFVTSKESFESAVNRADQALYQAKGAGRNCVKVAPEPQH